MAVTEGWSERTWRSSSDGRLRPRSASRSLQDALSEAGLGDAAPDQNSAETPSAQHYRPPPAPAPDVEAERPPLSSPRVAYFAEQVKASAAVKPISGVVSPPPWLRAARRGRLHTLMLNTFGWAMAIIVAGSIVGVAGRYLAVTPSGLETMQTARQ